MNLDETQTKAVSAWIAEGLKLSEIQTRLASQFGVRLTYMEVRLLVDDLKLTPKDAEAPKPVPELAGPKKETAPPKAATPGNVSVSVDQIARPGAILSGKVTFSDGHSAEWQLDQTGRLGLVPQKAGYRPPPADLQQFQMALETELSKLGF